MFDVAPTRQSARRWIAIILILIGAITSSFIAPISKLSVSLNATSLLFYASAIAAVFHLIFINPRRCITFFGNARGLGFAFLGGASLTWSYVMFAWAIQNATNAFLPTFAFELYPFGIIFFSNFLIRLEGIRTHQWIWMALSIVGLMLLAVDSLQIEVSSTTLETYERLMRGTSGSWF